MARITFEYDPAELFDVLATVGDGGEGLGTRLVGAMLAPPSFAAKFGMAFYGVRIVKEPTP